MEELIQSAYRKTRSSIYYDRGNLHTRLAFSSQSDQGKFESRVFNKIKKVISPAPKDAKIIDPLSHLLRKLNVILQPKKLKNPETPSSKTFQTNIDWSDDYTVESYNYFIDSPVELHVLSTMWVITVGSLLEEYNSSDSYGWNLHKSATDINSLQLFKYYAPQYGKWRDQAIKRARRTVTEDKQNATIVGLDLKQFYYHVTIDWKALDQIIEDADWQGRLCSLVEARKLTAIIKKICIRYRQLLAENQEHTHPDLNAEGDPLPLGLSFSPILANWLLNDFDDRVQRELNPVYYGRYVDDLLFVVSSKKLPFLSDEEHPRDQFLNHYFVERGLLSKVSNDLDEVEYKIASYDNLRIQDAKIQIHHFDPKGSLGALDRFQNSIREIVSEFRFLPDTIPTEKLESLSFDLLYDGSRHSLKSVKGFEVNRWQLSHILSTAAATRLFATEGKQLKEESKSLQKILFGILGLKFYDMWEKIFTVILLGDEQDELKRMYWHLKKCIKSVRGVSPATGKPDSSLTNLTKEFYLAHLDNSLAMAIALVGIENNRIQKAWRTVRDVQALEKITPTVTSLRESNLIRHQHVGSSLINFTNDRGDWTKPRVNWNDIQIQEDKLLNSPRFIHLDELSQAEFLTRLGGEDDAIFAEAYFECQLSETEGGANEL